jgi:hypothetical protein
LKGPFQRPTAAFNESRTTLAQVVAAPALDDRRKPNETAVASNPVATGEALDSANRGEEYLLQNVSPVSKALHHSLERLAPSISAAACSQKCASCPSGALTIRRHDRYRRRDRQALP